MFNLRWLNQFIHAEHFKMEDMRTAISMLQPGDWFTKVDIKDAFTHVPMHPETLPYLAFRSGSTLFQFVTMPFGLNTAPRVFTKVLRPIVASLRARGVRLVTYIDDILILASSREQSTEHTRWLLELLSYLGFLVNWPKSVLVPARSIEFLGFILNSEAMTIALPPNKLNSLRHRVSAALEAQSLPLRALASLVGALNASAMAVMPTRLRTRSLLRDKIDALHSTHGEWTDTTVTLSATSRRELLWWQQDLQTWNGRSLVRTEPDRAMYSDASNTGWGAVLGDQTAFGHWSSTEASLHINELELLAVLFGLQSFLPRLRGHSVLLRVDNTVAVAYLNHQGGTHSRRLSEVAQAVWDLALDNGMMLEAQHIPGLENVEADAASRQTPAPHEWCLHPAVFRDLFYRFGPLEIDLFATILNRQLPRYFSWRPDPETSGLDALQQRWPGTCYANPPWILIPDILRKVRTDRARLVLVAPAWPSQPWYPTLLALLHAPPVLLPTTAEGLFCPDRSPGTAGPPTWTAAAWPLCGDASWTTAYHRALPSWQAPAAPIAPGAITIQPGPGGRAGVLNGKLIQFADR